MEREREIEFLQRLARTAAETLDATSLVDLVIAETTGAMDADVCSVYLLEPDGVHLRLSATNGLSQAGVGHVRLRLREGITGWAAAERSPVIVPDVREDRRFRWLPGIDQARFVSMCSVPIISADRLVGVLNIQTDRVRHFTVHDVALLKSIAAQVAGVLERSALHAKLESQIADLRRSQEIHGRFTELSLTGAGVMEICEEIAAQAACGVALYDVDGERRLMAGPGADDLPERLRPSGEPTDDDGVIAGRHRIHAGANRLGWLLVTPAERRSGIRTVESRMAIEHGLTVLALECSRERAAAETEERLRGNLIDEIMEPGLDDADVARITERGLRLGYRLRTRMWVAVLAADDDEGRRELLRDPVLAGQLRSVVTRLVQGRHPGSIVTFHRDELVLLITEPAAVDHVERCARHIVRVAGEVAGTTLSCGVSGRSGGPAEFAELAGQARLARRVGRRMGRRGEVSSHRRLGTERLLMAVTPDDELTRFVEEWLGPLIRHEAQGGRAAAPLLDTLEALTATGWSLRASARRLSVHVNTLIYRIQRIREVVRRDVDDPDVRLAFALALRARTMRMDEVVNADDGETEATADEAIPIQVHGG